jgi:hypothetical protein
MSITALLPSWELALEPGGKSRTTIRSCLSSMRSLAAFLRANDMPGDVDDVTTEGIRAFLAAEPARNSQVEVTDFLGKSHEDHWCRRTPGAGRGNCAPGGLADVPYGKTFLAWER